MTANGGRRDTGFNAGDEAVRQNQGKSSRLHSVFFLGRMGDFYEMFFEDAVTAAPVLEITLTSRNKGKEDSVPPAGFRITPFPRILLRWW